MTVTVPGPVLGAAMIMLVLFGALALAWPAPRGAVLSLMGALALAALIWYWRSPGAARSSVTSVRPNCDARR